MAIGQIPWTSILSYATHHGLEPDLVDLFIFVVRQLDSAYLKWQEEQIRLSAESR